jgi:hypothetical protein
VNTKNCNERGRVYLELADATLAEAESKIGPNFRFEALAC